MPKSTADHSSAKAPSKAVKKKAAERLTSCPTHSRTRTRKSSSCSCSMQMTTGSTKRPTGDSWLSIARSKACNRSRSTIREGVRVRYKSSTMTIASPSTSTRAALPNRDRPKPEMTHLFSGSP